MGDEPGSRRVVGDWEILHKIGSGSFAIVWKAVHRVTRIEAAVKEINTANLNRKLQDSLASEITVLEKTRHPNIVGLLDIIKDGHRIFIVLEFCCGGDLGGFIKRYKKVQEATAKQFMHQLAEGLKELRSLNLVHRDLKPQNLLLSARFTPGGAFPLLKIADFGFARSLHPQTLADTLCGSPLYMAPEILQAQRYGAKADLWSVGVILFELVAGKPPFGGNNHVQLLHNINTTEARLPDAVAACLSDSCRSLLRLLLRRNPVDRLTFEEFFAHPFIQDSAATSAAQASVPLLPPEPPLAPGEAGPHPDDLSEAPGANLLSEALEKTISRWASQHVAAAAAPTTTTAATSPRVTDPGQGAAAPAAPSPRRSDPAGPLPLPLADPVSAGAPGSSPGGSARPAPRPTQQQGIASSSGRPASQQQQGGASSSSSSGRAGALQPQPSPRQRSGVARQLSAGSGAAAAVMQNLLMGLSPPRLPPLFSFSQQSASQQQQQPTPPSQSTTPTPFHQQQPAAASGGSADDFDHDFVIVSSPQQRSPTPPPAPQLLHPRAPTPEQHPSFPPNPTPGAASPMLPLLLNTTTTTATALQRAPSRSALTTQLAAAAASGSSTPLSGSGTLPTPPASTSASAYIPSTPASLSPTPPLPHSFPATCPLHHMHPTPSPTPTPTAPPANPPTPLGSTASIEDHPLQLSRGTGSTTPPLPCSYSATPSVLLADAPPTVPPATSPTPGTPPSTSSTTSTTPAAAPSTSAAAPASTSTPAAASTSAAVASTSAVAAAAAAAVAQPPHQTPARLTTSTNPILPPTRLQRLLSDGVAAVANNVDASALLPRVVAVLLDRCERLTPPHLQQPPQRHHQRTAAAMSGASPSNNLLAAMVAGGTPPTSGGAFLGGPGVGMGLGLGLGPMGMGMGAVTAPPAAGGEAGGSEVMVEILGQRLAAMQLLQAACGDPRFRPQSPAAAAALQELAQRADEGLARALAAAEAAGQLPRQGAAARAGFGALLQCVMGLCRVGGGMEQAGGAQRRAALVEYASAMDVLLLLLLDAGSAGGPRGRAAVEQQLLRMYAAVAARWTAAGGGQL